MAKKVEIGNLSNEFSFVLSSYQKEKTEKIKKCAEEKMDDLVKHTKEDANKLTGKYRDSIDSKVKEENSHKKIMLWYVKDSRYRLSHLLNDGHRTRSGGKTRANNFISKNTEKAISEYEKEVELILSDG